MKAKQLDKAQVNHLRRLLGWVRCDIGQSPEEMVAMMKGLLPHLGPISDDGKARSVEAYQRVLRVPAYIRAALKSLAPVVEESKGEVVDYETAVVKRKLRFARKQLNDRTKRLLP